GDQAGGRIRHLQRRPEAGGDAVAADRRAQPGPAGRAAHLPDGAVLLGHERRHPRLHQEVRGPPGPPAHLPAGRRVQLGAPLPARGAGGRHDRFGRGDGEDEVDADRRPLQPERAHPRRWPGGARHDAGAGEIARPVQGASGLLQHRAHHSRRLARSAPV
ncbi:hypothetical protein OY671_011737, partial [Metschnikowia pulcherrima]